MSTVLKNPFSTVPASSLPNPQDRSTLPDPNNPEPKKKPISGIVPDNITDDDDSIDPSTGKPKDKKKPGDDPMYQFDKLWDNEIEDPKNPKPKEPTGYLPAVDPKKLTDMVGKMDFTKSVTPEQLQAINGGGENATKALFQVINDASRQALIAAFQSSTRLSEKGFENAKNRFLGEVPSHVKDIMVQNGLNSSSAIMKNPAYAPMVDGVRARFQERYPKATPAQIETVVNKYFTDMANEITGSAKAKETTVVSNADKLKKGTSDADWDSWLNNVGQNNDTENQVQL
jgi:hypothetical protein